MPWTGEGEAIHRLPASLGSYPELKGVNYLAKHSAGAAVRFRTNSKNIYLKSDLAYAFDMPHMAHTGSAGFDFFQDFDNGRDKHICVVRARTENITGQKPVSQKLASFPDSAERDFVLWLPLYGSVKSLSIGLDEGAKILPPRKRSVDAPVVFYGSSVTQGGCASRTGNAYTTMLCRAVDAPQVNLGFSGNAKGEIPLAKAIASLDMSVFVYDYDFNAPNAEHLAKTHEPFFLEIRKANPDLPVIMLTSCTYRRKDRRDIIKRTYENALKRGDKNVYFIDGEEFFGGEPDEYATVDNCHPNDLGFYLMYKRILPVLKEALDSRKKK